MLPGSPEITAIFFLRVCIILFKPCKGWDADPLIYLCDRSRDDIIGLYSLADRPAQIVPFHFVPVRSGRVFVF